MNLFVWTDELSKARFLTRMWRSFALLVIPITFFLTVHNLWLEHSYEKVLAEKRDRIILTPAIRSPVVIEYGSEVSNDYILQAARRVVNLQENWSYLTINENYNELFRLHSSFEFEKFLQANLTQTGFIAKIQDFKMVSSFRWDPKKSKATWCTKLGAACAMIIGNRHVFEDGNKPLSVKEVGYFLISNAVYPTEERPTALQINRLIIEDQALNPLEKLEPVYTAAKEGILPEGNNYANF